MQKTIIAVFEKQQDAINTVESLKIEGFTKRHMTLLGKLDADDNFDTKATTTAVKGVGTGLALGGVVGALAGAGVFIIPGLGFLYGAGALIGTLVGLDFGIITGGIISNLLLDGEKSEIADVYDQELHAGKTVLIVKTSAERTDEALKVIQTQGNYNDVKVH